jgi:GH25 family lysozyme M1 (1,4-beta-N-acetylmuramidase)
MDYSRARAEGAAFILHKATQGTSYAYTGLYQRRIAAIRASGVVPGAGHFLSTSDPRGQAHYFLDVIGDPNGLLVQLDWEPDGSDRPSPSVARAWVEEFHAQTGGHPVLMYYPHWFWEEQGSPGGLADLGPLWASHYVSGSGSLGQLAGKVPGSWWSGYAGWSRPKILQYTETGRVAGVSNVDFNIFDGTLAELDALTGEDMTPDQSAKLDAIAHQMYFLYTGSLDDVDNVAPRWWRRIVTGAYDSPSADNGVGLQQLGDLLTELRTEMQAIRQGSAAAAPATNGAGTLSDADVDRIARRVVELQSSGNN